MEGGGSVDCVRVGQGNFKGFRSTVAVLLQKEEEGEKTKHMFILTSGDKSNSERLQSRGKRAKTAGDLHRVRVYMGAGTALSSLSATTKQINSVLSL